MGKKIMVDPEFQSFLPPLSPEEYLDLEHQILKEGCRHAIILWNNIIIDGHNRYAICKKHGLSFRTMDMCFEARDDVTLWMIKNQMSRRNLTDYQRTAMVIRRKEAIAARANPGARNDLSPNSAKGKPHDTRRELAMQAGVSTDTVSKVGAIQANAVPEIIEAVSNGSIGVDVAAKVATLSKSEQVALAARGKGAMKAAAKAIREAKRTKCSAASSQEPTDLPEEAAPADIEINAQAGPQAGVPSVLDLDVNVAANVVTLDQNGAAEAICNIDVPAIETEEVRSLQEEVKALKWQVLILRRHLGESQEREGAALHAIQALEKELASYKQLSAEA
jgi:hypothetical protein